MAALADAMKQGVWFDQAKVEEAEYKYQMYLAHGKAAASSEQDVNKNKGGGSPNPKPNQPKSKQPKSNQPKSNPTKDSQDSADLSAEVAKLKLENEKLQKVVSDMTARFAALESRLGALEGGQAAPAAPAAKPQEKPAAPVANGVEDSDDDDDDDLFGSDDEDDDGEAEKVRQERLAAYAAKKAAKPGPIAKSNIILDVKPWDDETDMNEVERLVRTISCDGLKWGASKFAKIAYGITKLQITCVVEDDKVGTDFLEEEICAFEDHVQSVDIAAFNKI